MTEIKFCENNFTFGTDETMKKLKENYPGVDITAEACLGYCGDCAVGPYALVDDELIQAGTADELYKKIKSMM
ncbi:YuzB family protein [Clostridium sp. CM027]|uniref:DUF1450 domain-containing protein n=1 Tax=Clostridium sp. CM027 TaxID=2849865 RepID=UPI001C6E3FF3|nr:DUF1450 domain-containing protein [Clostridium sp. CM027]MBW9145784.1 YuzB family protein [Clostridium sp. CM027]UVE42151.1 YuzB family protein [Clostridium sp. CM027]